MAPRKNRVIIWRQFPSPTKHEVSRPPIPMVPTHSQSDEQRPEHESDEAAIKHWMELADVMNGKRRASKKSSVG